MTIFKTIFQSHIAYYLRNSEEQGEKISHDTKFSQKKKLWDIYMIYMQAVIDFEKKYQFKSTKKIF